MRHAAARPGAGLSAVGLRVLARPARLAWFLAGAAAVGAGIFLYRRGLLEDGAPSLVYIGRPEPAVTTLELQQ